MLHPPSRWWTGFETSFIAGFFILFDLSCWHLSAILTECATIPDSYFEEVMLALHDTLPAVLDPLPAKQGDWDNKPSVENDLQSI